MGKLNIDKYKVIIITICKDYFMVLEKVIFGIISHSSFMWINALYSGFLGTARAMCIRHVRSDHEQQVIVYKKVAILLILASIVYTFYNSYSLFNGKTANYHLYICLGIATFTFVEFGLCIRELIKIRKINNPITKAVAYINFSSILASFVLTQTILTALHPEENHSTGNGVTALIFGGIMLIIGIIMLYNKKIWKEMMDLKVTIYNDKENVEIKVIETAENS